MFAAGPSWLFARFPAPLAGPCQTTGFPISSTPASRSSSRARSVVSSATPAVRSSSTCVRKPSRAASSAVARTQWSVAMPDHVHLGDLPRAQPVGRASRRSRRRPRTRCTPPSTPPCRTPRRSRRRRPPARSSGGSRRPRCPPRSARARSGRSRGCRRSGRRGRCGGRGWPRRAVAGAGRLPDQLGDRRRPHRHRRPPRGCPPSQKSFCTSTTIKARRMVGVLLLWSGGDLGSRVRTRAAAWSQARERVSTEPETSRAVASCRASWRPFMPRLGHGVGRSVPRAPLSWPDALTGTPSE